MSKEYWDNFDEKTPLKDDIYWSAKFHSFNQRKNDLYYIITVYKKEQEDFIPKERFGVVVSDPRYIEDITPFPKKREYILNFLARQAERRKTNIPENILWKGIGQEDIDKF
ncbi:MAG: hypothetical protein ACTSQJ_03425 [Promethearchaeota archaeon]